MTQTHQTILDLYAGFHQEEFLSSDPLEFPHRYSDPHDQEAIAVLASQLAYGNARLIRKAVQTALTCISESEFHRPRDFVASLSTHQGLKAARKNFLPFKYRFHTGEDVVELLRLLSRSWSTHGSLARHFHLYFRVDQTSIKTGLQGFLSDWKDWAKLDTKAFQHFLASPQGGSPCKRWCLFLKWMIRKDKIDLGSWQNPEWVKRQNQARPEHLIIPLDTHIGRVSRELGLTQRMSDHWKTAVEITCALKNLDPTDPTKFDFALTRPGILKLKKSK